MRKGRNMNKERKQQSAGVGMSSVLAFIFLVMLNCGYFYNIDWLLNLFKFGFYSLSFISALIVCATIYAVIKYPGRNTDEGIEELKRAIQWKRDNKIKNCIMKIMQWIILIELVLFGFFVGAIFLLTSLCSLIILDRVLLKVCEREEESLSEI